MKKTKLMLGDNIESLKKLPDNSIDSVVTDPPYGLSAPKNSGKTSKGGFMNKKWDYDVPQVEFWKEVYRVLKPGGHVLSFGGTRTYHRMVVNMEDAGFEIRDQIMWIYGSGFPKSHNIGKAVDKLEGNERVEWLDEKKTQPNIRGNGDQLLISASGVEVKDREPIKYSKGNSPYEGWGTAMKPAQEIIAVAQKPENLEGTALNLIYNIKKELWKLYVKIVESSSELNQVEQKEVLNTAQCLVEKNINIQDALQGLMDMSQLRLMENMNWNIVLLWHNILEDLYQKMSRYTTSTKSNLTIDLKTLKSLEWQNILENITQVRDNQTDGLNVSALTAVVLFNALNLKLKDIQQHSVEDNVIYKEDKMDCLNEPICLARKPLSEKSVAENVLKWKTGGINVDGCRIEGAYGSGQNEIIEGEEPGVFTNYDRRKEGSTATSATGYKDKIMVSNPEGRFPANIILECICDEVIKGEKGEVIKSSGRDRTKHDYNSVGNMGSYNGEGTIDNYNDKGDIHTNPDCPCRLLDEQSGVSDYTKKKDGNPGGKTFGGSEMKATSRFFYQAKVSKAERNMGLDGFEDKVIEGRDPGQDERNVAYKARISPRKNSHPTVKPINLMTYLCRLITPENGIVLDPFMGSGSTGIAAQLEGFRFVGMEMDNDYFKIAEARINNYEKYKKFLK